MSTENCSMCHNHAGGHKAMPFLEFTICKGCAYILKRTLQTYASDMGMNILWEAGSISRNEWLELREFIKTNQIRSIIEYGPGLTTELMSLEPNIEKIFCIEANPYWIDWCRRVQKSRRPGFPKHVVFFEYPRFKEIPDEIEGMDDRYDMTLVDGPDSGRGLSIEHAIKRSNLMYLHDPTTQDQLDVLKRIRNDGWEPFTNMSKRDDYRFWRKNA